MTISVSQWDKPAEASVHLTHHADPAWKLLADAMLHQGSCSAIALPALLAMNAPWQPVALQFRCPKRGGVHTKMTRDDWQPRCDDGAAPKLVALPIRQCDIGVGWG